MERLLREGGHECIIDHHCFGSDGGDPLGDQRFHSDGGQDKEHSEYHGYYCFSDLALKNFRSACLLGRSEIINKARTASIHHFQSCQQLALALVWESLS